MINWIRKVSQTSGPFVLMLASCLSPANGQVVIRGQPGIEASGPTGNLFIKENRERNKALKTAKNDLRGKQYHFALPILQKLIDADDDSFFYEDPDKRSRFLSHKSEALRLIETLPEDGREAYELRFGVAARQTLQNGLKSGDYTMVEEVARRFFHSDAGYEATYLIASQELDRGNHLSAALHFDRLRKLSRVKARQKFEPMLSLQAAVCWGRAGIPKLSIQTLVELKQMMPGRTVEIAGRSVRLFNGRDDALTWLADTLGHQKQFQGLGQEQWVMFRGDGTRTAHSAPASPVWDAVWNVNTIRNADADIDMRQQLDRIKQTIDEFSKIRRKDGLLMQPGLHPLIVGDLAVFRTLHSIWAVNLRTGELEWKTVKADGAFLKVAGNSNSPPVTRSGRTYSQPNANLLNPLNALLDQRLWRDLTAGTLSSDGEFIYAVEDLDFYNPQTQSRSGFVIRNGRRETNSGMTSYNELVAYHAKTGKLKLELGGKDDGKGKPLAGHFFLGAPLPLGEQLFCLADYRGEIRLLVLETRKETDTRGNIHLHAKLLWSQSLTMPDVSVTQSPLRRMAGLSPSYAGGVIICPTAGGAVVAVDPARRLLMWGYQYPTNTAGNALPNGMMMIRGQTGIPANSTDAESRWLDAAVTVADSRIILTPRDSNELHCVGLLDGSLQWKQSREHLLYVAAVQDQNIILAGKTEMKAVRLTDGSAAWKQSVQIPEPSGRGFQTGRFYHIPLETAEIATIDLLNGRVLAQTKTRSGLIPGNLVSANGLIVSQSIDRVVGFKPFDVLQKQIADKLTADRKDSQALALRGEIRLRSGDEPGGLTDLRDSVASKPSDRARSLLASNLIEGLRTDFASFRKYRPEIEKLLTNAEERSRYHRLLAAGLHEVGEFQDAFQEYLKLAGPNTGTWKDEQVSGGLTARGDRWMQSRVDDIYRKSTPEVRQRLKLEMRKQLAMAVHSGGPAGVRRFIEAFGNLPISEEARTELVRRLDKNDNAMELEFLLHHLRQSPDRTTAGQATAQLALLFETQAHLDAAAELLAILNTQYADVPCDTNKTGREIAKERRQRNPQLAAVGSQQSAWPRRRMAASAERVNTASFPRSYPIDVEGNRGPYFQNWSFSLDTSQRKILGVDGTGHQRLNIAIPAHSNNFLNGQYGNSLHIHGHLVVAVLANRFMVIDGLSKTPKVLWSRDLYESSSNQQPNRGIQVRNVVRLPGGRAKWVITDPSGNPLGEVGPVSENQVVYQSGRTVFAANPITGDVLWKRDGMQRGSRLFGDKEFVFVVSPGSTTATVLRGIDGEELGSRPVAAESTRKATNGRFELTWEQSGGKYLLSYVDLMNKKIVWQKQFSEEAKMVVVDGVEAAVVEPKKGHVVIVSLVDGKTRLDQPIEPDPGLNYFMVRRTNDRYVLLSYSPRANVGRNALRVNGVNYYSPLIHGYVYGFDRATGKKLWTTFVRDQAYQDDQPGNLPVIIFAARRYKYRVQAVNVPRSTRNISTLAVTILDIRNGRMVLDYDVVEQSVTMFGMDVNLEKKTIDLKFYRHTIKLNLTDKPLAKSDPKVLPRKQAEEDPDDPADDKPVNGKLPNVRPVPGIPIQRGIQIQRRR